jgi:hypothetical protein
MRDYTQLTQEERYQIEGLLQTGRQHSKIVQYGNVLASRLRISYSQESNHRLHLRVESADCILPPVDFLRVHQALDFYAKANLQDK